MADSRPAHVSAQADIQVIEADCTDPRHADDLFAMLGEFARHPVSGPSPLGFKDAGTISDALAGMPHASVLLAYVAGKVAGFAICYELFSTFNARPYIYVHDLMTSGAHRGKGVGQAILERIERIARENGCVRIDLEVVEGNEPAKRLYARNGFVAASPNPDLGIEQHWNKTLE